MEALRASKPSSELGTSSAMSAADRNDAAGRVELTLSVEDMSEMPVRVVPTHHAPGELEKLLIWDANA